MSPYCKCKVTVQPTRDVKFESTGLALGPKSGQTGLLHGLSVSCWAQNKHGQVNTKSRGLDDGMLGRARPTWCGAGSVLGSDFGKILTTLVPTYLIVHCVGPLRAVRKPVMLLVMHARHVFSAMTQLWQLVAQLKAYHYILKVEYR